MKAGAFLLKLSGAFCSSANFLFRLKPDVCVGFGSYVSFPGMLLAAFFKIPTLIHEQNLIPGKASEWLAPRVRSVAVSFEETFLHTPLRSRYVTGLPLRPSLCENAKKRGMKGKERFCILVVGGSQGAHPLNGLVLDALGGLEPEEKQEIAVIHIAGAKDYEWVSESYRKMKIANEVFPFHEKIHELYPRADMAITRAGANTLFELSLFQLPAIVVPYPYAEAHQTANAAYFQSRRAVICKNQNTLTAEELRREILHLMNNEEERERFSKKLEEISSPDAGERLVDLTENLLTAKRTYAYC